MIPISLKKLAFVTQGVLYQINDQNADSIWINTVTSNSRKQTINGLFIALKGKRFDGHHFTEEAIGTGAIALLVDHPLTINFPQIIVEDTRLAIGKLAGWVRSQSKAKVIGITGSSGKTSVKEMVASILSRCGKTLFTDANLNNDIGIALTLFRLTTEHQYAVIEMGSNHIGEIEYTTNIVRPDSVLVNNLFAAHLEGLGSLAGVAKEKGYIFKGLARKGTAVINLDSHNLKNWQFYFNKQQTICGFSVIKQQYANFYAENISIKSKNSTFNLHTPTGVISISLPLLGKHNIANALAASALAMSVGAMIEEVSFGLAYVHPLSGRLYSINLAPDKLLLDDTYNANIGSMIVAIDILSQISGYRILVVGDISELGDNTNILHQEIGDTARKMKIDRVLSVGKDSALISQQSGCGEHFFSKKELISKLIPLIKKYKIVSILVKGSRNTEMKEIVNALQEHFLC
ncbi:MAG: UDP-N-acetylmuramoyl-tripeptide--D-alanyl-D-alanine ligase [Arsenophonus sp.]